MTTQPNRRRGFWKRVRKARPTSTSEEIEVAESQYYSNVVNRLGETVNKGALEKTGKGNTKIVVTTYKPNYQFLKDFFETDDNDDQVDVIPNIEIPKISAAENVSEALKEKEILPTTPSEMKTIGTTEKINPGDMDLGTGSPDPTLDDSVYYTEMTEPTHANIDRSDGLSFMDYLFGESSQNKDIKYKTKKFLNTTPVNKIEAETEVNRLKATTESTYIPDEFTAETVNDNDDYENVTEAEIQRIFKKEIVTEKSVKVETSSISSFMNPANIVSTSMSTEVSHETEICFRGRCIKTNKNIL